MIYVLSESGHCLSIYHHELRMYITALTRAFIGPLCVIPAIERPMILSSDRERRSETTMIKSNNCFKQHNIRKIPHNPTCLTVGFLSNAWSGLWYSGFNQHYVSDLLSFWHKSLLAFGVCRHVGCAWFMKNGQDWFDYSKVLPSRPAVRSVDEGWVVCCASRREDEGEQPGVPARLRGRLDWIRRLTAGPHLWRRRAARPPVCLPLHQVSI